MNAKTTRYLLLAVLLVFSLLIVSCSETDGGEATQPPAAQATKSTSEEGTGSGEQPTEAPAAQETKSSDAPSGQGGIFANPQESLDSYRMRTVMVLKEGQGPLGEEMVTEIEWVREPEATHMIMYGASGEAMLETILIGQESWMSMGDGNWIHTPAGSEEETAMPQDLQTDLEDLLKGVESSMKELGKDEVDGVRCTRYAVDTDFSMPFPLETDAPAEAQQFMPQEIQGHVEGEVCVADERGLPEVIVRSQTTQRITIKYASGNEEMSVYDEDREMYDINEPITIKPPEGAMEMPTMPTMPAGLAPPSGGGDQPQPPAGEPASAIQYAELNELDSYRLEWTVTIKTEQGETSSGYQVEWTKEPLAAHLTMNMAEGMPAIEYVWANDTVWMNPGSGWMLGSKEEMDDAINQVGAILTPEDDMVLVGQETVNGVACQHYVKEITFQPPARLDIWIADQGNLPPVVVRGISQMEMSGMTMITQANVYDINAPITIDVPQ